MSENNEYSVVVDLDAIAGVSRDFKLSPDPEERAAIAERLGVASVDRLAGSVRIEARKSAFRVEGRIEAAIARICVASLEPMVEVIDEAFTADFTRTPPSPDDDEDGADLDGPEYHEGPLFDLGEYFVQQTSLAMDPFPRNPGAAELAATYGEDKPISPFADLLKGTEKSDPNQ